MALSRVHNSTKTVTVKQMPGKMYPELWGIIQPLPNRNNNPTPTQP